MPSQATVTVVNPLTVIYWAALVLGRQASAVPSPSLRLARSRLRRRQGSRWRCGAAFRASMKGRPLRGDDSAPAPSRLPVGLASMKGRPLRAATRRAVRARVRLGASMKGRPVRGGDLQECVDEAVRSRQSGSGQTMRRTDRASPTARRRRTADLGSGCPRCEMAPAPRYQPHPGIGPIGLVHLSFISQSVERCLSQIRSAPKALERPAASRRHERRGVP